MEYLKMTSVDNGMQRKCQEIVALNWGGGGRAHTPEIVF